MTNLETLQKQQLEAMNQMFSQILNAATAMNTAQVPQIPVQAPQNNTSHLENQLAEMQANMQQMMQIISQQQQMIQMQQMVQPQMMQQPIPSTIQHVTAQPEPVTTNFVAEPAPATPQNESVYKVSSKLVKPCESCPFAQTCAMRTKQ